MDLQIPQEFYEAIDIQFVIDMLGSLLEGVIIADLDGNILYVNQSFTSITGYTLNEVAGKNPSILSSDIHNKEFYEDMWDSISTKGQWQGEIWNRRKNGESYPEWLRISIVRDKFENPSFYLGVFTDISKLNSLQEQLDEKASFDTLTGLRNRYGLLDHLRPLPIYDDQTEQTYVFLLLDIDRFITINDSLGHDIGDEILKQVAIRLKSFVTTEEFVARMGGDEFAAILKRRRLEDVVRIVREISHRLKEPLLVLGKELFITVSIGVSLGNEDLKDWNDLIQRAEVAMYRARKLGGDNYQFYKLDMQPKSLERINLETMLRKALDQQEFVLHYQPQIHLISGKAIGLEALIRWNNPHMGMVSPAEFIPLAEETGLIIPIGVWVLETACKQAKAWLDSGYPIRIAVNLSMRQFLQKNLVSMISRTLINTNLPPHLLELEITESFAMGNVEVVLKKMQALKDLGICISIDDFGTGYSSLSYLRKFPIDTLKIDQSFIKDITTGPDGAAISKAIIALAHNLNCNVVAEGVEEKDQLLFLLHNNCDHVQGYYFSRPLPAEAIEVFLKEKQFPGMIKF